MSSTSTTWTEDSKTKATNDVTQTTSQTLSGTLTAAKIKAKYVLHPILK